jgi:hypothetical protein
MLFGGSCAFFNPSCTSIGLLFFGGIGKFDQQSLVGAKCEGEIMVLPWWCLQ